MAEGNDRKCLANVSGIHPTILSQTLLRKTGSKFLLVRAQDFHALTKDHEGFIDITSLLQTVSSGMSVLGAFRASKVNQRKSGYLQRSRVLDFRYQSTVVEETSINLRLFRPDVL